MASPPFNISESVPGDDDFVAPYPAAERTFRDIVESWFLVEGNTSGRSNLRAFDQQGSSPTGVTGVTTVWAEASGYLMYRRGTGAVMFLEDAPGTVKVWAGPSAPEGWLLAYGQAISRSTYSALFDAIGTTHGIGDGSSTFNVPDLRGRVVAGQDDMGSSSANRLTGLTDGVNGDTFGAAGGLETNTLTTAQMPTHTHSVTDPGHSHTITPNGGSVIFGGGANGPPGGGGFNLSGLSVDSNTTGISIQNAGSGAAHNNVQPTIILNYIIKF